MDAKQAATIHIILLLLIFCLTSASGEVVDSSATGFTVRDTLAIAATSSEVYHRLTKNIGQWWSSEHTFSGNSQNLYIEDNAHGCFCEKLDNGGSVRHLTVVFADPDKSLQMVGALGPLQSMGVTGSMTWRLTPLDKGTHVELTYAVGGYAPDGLQHLAAPVNRVLMEQLLRLKRYVETGTPEENSQRDK